MGELLTAGLRSNYRPDVVMNHIYFTELRDGAGPAAELTAGEGAPRVYLVEPAGAFEDDPNVTDKKFPVTPPGPTQQRTAQDRRRGDRLEAAMPSGVTGTARAAGGTPRR
jgi:hypothetical protein